MTSLYTTTGGFFPMFSPDGRYVLAGNGVLKLIDLDTKTEQRIAASLVGFLRGGWYGPRQILIQHDDGGLKGDGFLYSYDVLTGRLTVFRQDANYRGGQFRAWHGHWCVVQHYGGICLDGVWLGKGYNSTDLSETVCASNWGTPARVRLIDVTTRVITDVVPTTGPNVVRTSRGHVTYGYFGPSALRVPGGTQGLVNITKGEGPAKVAFGPSGPWVVTGAEISGSAYMLARPLGHTAATALIFPHAGNRVDAVAVSDRLRVAGDQTNGHLAIYEAAFSEPLRPLPTPPPPSVTDVQKVPRDLWFGGFCFKGLHVQGLETNCELRVVQPDHVLAPGELGPVSFLWHEGTRIAAYVAGNPDGILAALEKAIEAAKVHDLPIIAYWPRSLQLGPLPAGADLIGVEAYQQEATLDAWKTRVRTSVAKCPQAVLIAQCYTSNAGNTKDLLPLVAPYSDLLNDYPNVWGCLLFSGAGRATGLEDHPEVWPYWAVVADSVTTPEIINPPEPIARPRVTMSYTPNQGTVPLTVEATWWRQPGSGPIDTLTFHSRVLGTTVWWNHTPDGHPLDDPTYNYHFVTAGTYELNLRANGPGGTGQTGSQRLVTVQPPVVEPPIEPPIDPPEPPMSERPQYDSFVNTESPAIDANYRQLHNNAVPDPSDIGHNHYRRLAKGWAHDEVLLGMGDATVNCDSTPWFGYVPVAYDPFVFTEIDEVAAAYKTHGADRPTPNDLGHTSYRRFAEFWTHADILRDIKGEPLQDGGAGATKPDRPPVDPGGPVDPTVPPLPTTNPLALKTDFLTLRHNSSDTILYCGPYPAYKPEKRKKILEALKQNGYTDCWVDATMGKQSGGFLHDVEPYDFLPTPQDLRPFLLEIRAAGLRTLLVIGFEDNKPLDAKYPVSKLTGSTLPAFIPKVDDLVSCYMLGVEVREYWTWDEVLKIAQTISKHTERPILIHQNQRKWGPDREDPWSGGGEMDFWKKMKKNCAPNKVALAFQGGHRATEDGGGGFLSNKEELVRDIKGFVDPKRLGGIGVEVISSEYGHKVPDEKTKPLGKASLDAGAIGFTNGGPK